MSKEELKHICTLARKDSYSWALYFFKIDKRAKQPFKANNLQRDLCVSYIEGNCIETHMKIYRKLYQAYIRL